MIMITIHVDPAAAVRAGKSKVGEQRISLNDTDLASLTQEQRETLARHVAGDRYYGEPLHMHADPVADAGMDFPRLLDQRAAYAIEREAEDRAQLELVAQREQEEHERRRVHHDSEVERLKTVPIVELNASIFHAMHAPGCYVLQDRGMTAAEYVGRGEELRQWKEQERAQEEREKAQREAETERNEAALGGLIERLAPEMLPRYRDGYLGEIEIENLLKKRILAPALEERGLTEKQTKRTHVHYSEPDELTQNEHEAWVAVRDWSEIVLPDGTKAPVTINLYFASVYRLAEEGEDGDTDGEVHDCDRVVVLVSTEIYGVTIEAVRMLPQ